MRKLLPGLVVIALAFGFGLWAWGRLPAEVATHWGVDGRPDGWSSRSTAVLFLPAIGVGVALLLAVLPRIDPKRDNFTLHASTYWIVANATLIFLGAVQVATLAVSLGWPVRMDTLIGVGAGGLLILIGNLMTRLRPNWFIGIRTPWTLSSEQVWRKTHRVGGYAFVAAGAVMVLSGLSRSGTFAIVALMAVGAAALVPVVYSYFVWRAEMEAAKPRADG